MSVYSLRRGLGPGALSSESFSDPAPSGGCFLHSFPSPPCGLPVLARTGAWRVLRAALGLGHRPP